MLTTRWNSKQAWTTLLRVAFVAILVAHAPVAVCAEEPNVKRAETITALIRFLESEFKAATERLDRRSSSLEDVDSIHADLIKARHDSAVINDDRKDTLRQCEELIAVRNRQLRRQVKLNQQGFGSKRELIIAMRRLAGARYQRSQVTGANSLVELEQVVQLCNEELKLLANLKTDGAASAMEVNRARHRAMIAEYCLASHQDDKAKLLSKITLVVERSSDELVQIKRLRAQGFADSFDVYFAQRTFLGAKLLLANLQKDFVNVGTSLDELIRIHDELLPKLGSDRRGKLLRTFVENERERDRSRRDQSRRDGYLADEVSLGELGF